MAYEDSSKRSQAVTQTYMIRYNPFTVSGTPPLHTSVAAAASRRYRRYRDRRYGHRRYGHRSCHDCSCRCRSRLRCRTDARHAVRRSGTEMHLATDSAIHVGATSADASGRASRRECEPAASARAHPLSLAVLVRRPDGLCTAQPVRRPVHSTTRLSWVMRAHVRGPNGAHLAA